MFLTRRALDRRPQTDLSCFVKRVKEIEKNPDPEVRRPYARTSSKFTVEERYLRLFEGALSKASAACVGRPLKLVFEYWTLKLQRVDKADIKKYIAGRDYSNDPRRSINSFISDEEDGDFLEWLDKPAELAANSSITADTRASPILAKTNQGSACEVHAILDKYQQLAQNKVATVRWFQEKLKNSEIARRLQPSNIQYWLKTRGCEVG
ncbi:hypothetical protein CYMTET_7253 [Cymbomonas tetramitiformis]|uniref:Uncharacterized protein n=1 Tax=Cymbomonas tetramitiformis TaxID=36881 RepID=A0AAE0GVV1_9CHLO|nr:hypothetical protein CYMTET_7253 [Cymbomonas tetramitiformis]